MTGSLQPVDLPGSGLPGQNVAASSTGWRWGAGEWGLLAVFLLALLAMSPIGHILAIFALISLIGIPIYFVIAALPAVFLAYLFLFLLWRTYTSFIGNRFLAGALFAACALLMADYFVLRAWRENSRLDSAAAALVAGDTDRLGAAGEISTLAVVRSSRTNRNIENVCDDICQRLLLTGAVKKVLAITLAPPPPQSDGKKTNARRALPGPREEASWPALEIHDGLAGIVYSLEQRSSCPENKMPENVRVLSLPRSETGKAKIAWEREVPAPEALRIRLASGTCLIAAPATLAQADGALAYGTLASGRSGMGLGFDVAAEALNAWRLTFHRRIGGNMVPHYRATGVRYERFPGALVPTILHGSEFRTSNGFMRYSVLRGERRKYQDEPEVAHFAVGRLGLKLSIDPAEGPRAQGGVIDGILDASRPRTPLENKIVADYLGQIRMGAGPRDAAPDEVEMQRILRIAGDMQIELPSSISAAAALIGSKAPHYAPVLARFLFMRLAGVADQSPPGRERGLWNETITRASRALAHLPDDTLRSHRGEIERIARNRTKRYFAEALLNRLDLFGPEIVPVLFELIEDAVREGEDKSMKSRDGNWTKAYRIGLNGLCKLGPQASFALPQMTAFARANAEIVRRRFRDLTVTTMVRLGANESEIRTLLGINTEDERAERDFQQTIRRASGNRPCS